MRKIVGFILLRSFEKSYSKCDKHIKVAFRERRNLLLMDQNHPILNIHPLHGKWLGFKSINITGNVRAVFKMEGFFAVFFDIGTHNQLYK